MKWQSVFDELEQWSSIGKTARIWLRDDDAIEPTAELDRFLDLTAIDQVPVLLAVIPAGVKDSLAVRLESADWVAPAIHGWAHFNHAPEGEKSQELGPHRAMDDVLAELATGFRRLSGLFADRLVPVLVPPWNRIDPDIIPHLSEIGFQAVSAFGRKPLTEEVGGLKEINTHVDLIDWRGTRGCRDHGDLITAIAAELAISRKSDGVAVGILSHHLIHDDGVNAFLSELFDVIGDSKNADWISTLSLIS